MPQLVWGGIRWQGGPGGVPWGFWSPEGDIYPSGRGADGPFWAVFEVTGGITPPFHSGFSSRPVVSRGAGLEVLPLGALGLGVVLLGIIAEQTPGRGAVLGHF